MTYNKFYYKILLGRDYVKGIILSKIEEKKQEKENKLLLSAYKLFTEKGINTTSIQDIVDDAGVAKGTFYLYFKDKYDLQNKLIIKKSQQLFKEALDNLNKNVIINFEDQLIFIIDYIINIVSNDKTLINFIEKDLSLGIYSDVNEIINDNKTGIKEIFIKGLKKHNIKLKNPDVTLFMIIELTSSTIFTSITKNKPLKIEEYKPYLYSAIRRIIKEK